MTCKKCGLLKPDTEYRNYAPKGWCIDCRKQRRNTSMQKTREEQAYQEEREMWMRVSAATVKYSPEVTKKLVNDQWDYWENHPGTANTKRIVAENARLWDLHYAGSCSHTLCPYHKR